MFRKARRDLLDRELGGGDDGSHVVPVALILGPAQLQESGFLSRLHPRSSVLGEPEGRGLENRRYGGADDVLSVVGKIGMPAGREAREAAETVTLEGDLEHAGRWNSYGSVILVILTSA